MPEKDDKDKLIFLYTLLFFNNREWSIKELCKLFNCSSTTISKLIHDLEGFKCINIKVRKNDVNYGCKFERLVRLSKISINIGGFSKLTICREFLIGLLPYDMQQKVRSNLDQSITYLDNKNNSISSEIGNCIENEQINSNLFKYLV